MCVYDIHIHTIAHNLRDAQHRSFLWDNVRMRILRLANILYLFVGSSSTIDIFTVLNSQDQDVVIYDYKDDSVVTDTKLA